MKTINDRYEIIKALSRSNHEIEYLVTDLEHGNQTKRMRIFDTDMSNNPFVKVLEDGFIELKNIVHENVLLVHEFQTIKTINGSNISRKQYFYTYEDWAEGDRVSYLELNKSEIISVLVQICKAMRFIHFRGIVYKYLNFDQIIILRTNNQIVVKIKDIANNYINDYYFKSDYERFGHFVAPEILWGEEIDKTVDIYSLGTVFFYIYYQVDFYLKNMRDVIRSDQENDIYQFIKKATSNIKEERFPNIHDFISGMSKLLWTEVDHKDAIYYDKINRNTRIAGRDTILVEIKKHIEQKFNKEGLYDAIFIRGEAGTGKTRLLREVAQIAKFNRYDYIFLKPSLELNDGFSSVRKIVKFISEKDDVSPMLAQKYGQELICILPELKDKWNIKSSEVIDPQKESMRVMNRAFNFFLEYSAANFILIIVDEYNEVHSNERFFYDQLLEAKSQNNYFVLMSGSDFDQRQKSEHSLIKTIKLPSLNLEETGEIVRMALGCGEIPYHLTHRLMVESQGKASKIERLIRQLWKNKDIYFDHQKMVWNLDKINDSFSFDFIDKRDDQFETILRELTEFDVALLKKLSLLTTSFNMQLVFEYGEIDEENGYYFLTKMEDHKILNKRISDVEYVFVFYSNDLRKFFSDLMHQEEMQVLYGKLTTYYEKLYYSNQQVNEALIHYLIKYGDLEKAASICLEFSTYYSQQFNYSKTIELLEKGLEIYLKLSKKENILKTGLSLVDYLIKAGCFSRATEIMKVIAPYIPAKSKEAIDVKCHYAMIHFYKNEVNASDELARQGMRESTDIGYAKGFLKSLHMHSKCVLSSGDYEQHLALVNEGLAESRKAHLVFYEGMFLNEQGINLLYRGRYEDALTSFSSSLELYEQIKENEFVIRSYNNIGAVHFEGFGDFIIAREFFRKAYNLSQNMNYLMNIPTQLSNLGETYLAEGRIEMAIKYFQEANQLAERVSDKNMTMQALLNLCRSYVSFENYTKAYTLMSRLEHEYAFIEKQKINAVEYNFLHIEFYLAMKDIVKAEQWRAELEGESLEDAFRAFYLKILDLRLEFVRITEGDHELDYDFTKLETLIKSAEKPIEVKALREFTLEIIMEFLDKRAFLVVDRLIQLDDQMMKVYNTKSVRIKRDFIDASVSEYPFERIDIFLKESDQIPKEFLWKVLKITGDLYCADNKCYEGLNYSLMALDVIFDTTAMVPSMFKEGYILSDRSKVALKNRIDALIRYTMSSKKHLSFEVVDEHITTLNAFFDLENLNRLYKSSAFEKLIDDNDLMPKSKEFKTVTDLIKNLKKDEKESLRIILEYLMKVTLAESGAILLLDENDRISETFDLGNYSQTKDISKLINNVGNDMDGFYVSRLNSKTNIKLLSENQKGLMFCPIYEGAEAKSKSENRREDLLVLRNKIVGYVLLDSSSVMHRFNEETLEETKRFINLIYVFIDNYNLKRISTIDKLTGVYLRKYIEQQFAIQLSIARQTSDRLSVIMLDIDKFKNVNDTYGHRKGDEILERLGQILKTSIRSTDYVARYGGEEFIVLLPEADAKTGYKVAEKIRKIVESSKLLGEGKSLTISSGVATYPKDGANEEELIERADQALYYSKNNGRNQSTSWDDQLIKEGHRYDRLTGILTGNISADTRNVQSMLDVIQQLNKTSTREEKIKNIFITLLDITEADEVQFIQYDEQDTPKTVYSKKKGQEMLEHETLLNERLLERFKLSTSSYYFIDWDEAMDYDATEEIPVWKSYIVIPFGIATGRAFLSISVKIEDKEFDFSNYNFVDTLKPVLQKVLTED